MSDIIRINNLSFRYHNKFVFEKLDLSIRDGEWLAIVGPNGSGKSTLVKIIVGLLKFDGTLIIDNMPLSTYNIPHIRKQIGVVFENADDYFIGETVADDLAFALENLAYSPNEIEHMVLDIANTFKINDILDKDPHFLSGGQKQRVALAAALVTNPKILIIDDALAMIDEKEK
ncbi:MAG: ATP-binding cassette domain-containing protein, partial [Bacilli bacterium]|nr:ATP-binding cassette domain-containing protein [Bacilli bacterium]